MWNCNFLLEDESVAHDGIALSSAASAHSQYIYTGGNDGTLKVWQTSRHIVSMRYKASEALQGRLFTLLAEFIRFQSISSSPEHREQVSAYLTRHRQSSRSDLSPAVSASRDLVQRRVCKSRRRRISGKPWYLTVPLKCASLRRWLVSVARRGEPQSSRAR